MNLLLKRQVFNELRNNHGNRYNKKGKVVKFSNHVKGYLARMAEKSNMYSNKLFHMLLELNSWFQNKTTIIPHKFWVVALLIIGTGIRLRNYFFNRALWLDEATLSLNIIHRDYLQLLKPLDTCQVAPVGFLWVEKFFVSILGPNELALRLFPLIAGILSLFLFYTVAKKITNKFIALYGLLFFVFGYYLIYYSTEVKQYEIDVLAYLVCFNFIYLKDYSFKIFKTYVISGFIGASVIWFSHASVFILTGIGIGMFLELITRKAYSRISGYVIMILLWLVSFAVDYFFFINGHAHKNLQVKAFTSIGFLPGVSGIHSFPHWLFTNIVDLFKYPFRIPKWQFGAFLIICSLFVIIKKKEYKLLVLGLPVLIHLIASVFNIYPFGARFTLYTAFATVIFFVYGLYYFTEKTGIGRVLIGIVFLFMLSWPIRLSVKPITKQEIREPMQYIDDHLRNDDIVYVQYGSKWAFDFYKDRIMEPGIKIVYGTWIRSDLSKFDRELKRLKGKRVWILFSNYYPEEKKYILDECDEKGERMDSFEYIGSSAYLYKIFTIEH